MMTNSLVSAVVIWMSLDLALITDQMKVGRDVPRKERFDYCPRQARIKRININVDLFVDLARCDVNSVPHGVTQLARRRGSRGRRALAR